MEPDLDERQPPSDQSRKGPLNRWRIATLALGAAFLAWWQPLTASRPQGPGPSPSWLYYGSSRRPRRCSSGLRLARGVSKRRRVISRSDLALAAVLSLVVLSGVGWTGRGASDPSQAL